MRFPLVGHRQFRFSVPLMVALARQQSNYDVVHLFDVHTPMPAAARWCERPKVLTPAYHGRAVNRLVAPMHDSFTAAACRLSQRIVCASTGEQHLLEANVDEACGRVTVIHPGATSYLSEGRGPSDSDEIRVLVLARLVAYKRVDLVIQALAGLPGRVSLTIVGSGPELSRLGRLAAALKLDQRVAFLRSPERGDLGQIYATHDVLVSLSNRESLGLVLLDAAAAGLRLVASDIPPHREVLTRWAPNGVLVPLEAGAQSVANAIIEAKLAEPREHRAPLPDWNRYVTEHLNTYEATLRSGGRHKA
jgi:glycosyltransferase involved in cell wall biosynthesis